MLESGAWGQLSASVAEYDLADVRLVVDVALAALVGVAIAFAIGVEQEEGSKLPDAHAYLLGVAIAAPLLVRPALAAGRAAGVGAPTMTAPVSTLPTR